MDTVTHTAQYICMSCRMLVSGNEQYKAHYEVCQSPNIFCLGLVPKPQPAKGADEEKPEGVPGPLPVINGGQLTNIGQVLNIGQLMNIGQVMNAGQLINAGQVVGGTTEENAPSIRKNRKTGSVNIYGNQSVVINNYY